MIQTPVLIIGGSLVGLSAALFLSWRGVPTILVEKHQGSSPHPRATGFTEHSLEFFRAVGLNDQIPQVGPGSRLRRVKADSLSGVWHEETPWTPGDKDAFGDKASPCTGAAIAQDKLEPILRAAAVSHGADLRLGVEMLSFEQDDEGVVAQVRVRDSGEQYTIRAKYLIATDGAESAVRTALGINRQGVGHLRTLRSVLFRCPDAEKFLERGVQQFQLDDGVLSAFLTSYSDGRWVLMFDDDVERSQEELADAVRRALGNDFAFEVLATGRWEMAGRIAERYCEGRVFLAGDAAHQLPPTRGGFGANTGIEDVYNLAWKLEWVINTRSTPALLDSYNKERQPIGWLRHQQTFARPDYAGWSGNVLAGETLYSNEAMELGQLSRSSAVIGAGPELPPAAAPAEWRGQPGTRAPHLWMVSTGTEHQSSTVDLFTRDFVLISKDARWLSTAKTVARKLGVAIRDIHVGHDIVLSKPEEFEQQFGLSAQGASLVRPDGIIAWHSRGMPENAAAELEAALTQIASLSINPT